jgi:hypothetical protein
MKIFISCDEAFEDFAQPIEARLKHVGYKVILPDTYENKVESIKESDMILVINLEQKNIPGYIGGESFIDIYLAHVNKKKIYLYNQIPEYNLTKEIERVKPIVISGDLSEMQYYWYLDNLLTFESNPEGFTIEEWSELKGYVDETFFKYAMYIHRKHLVKDSKTEKIHLGENGQKHIDEHRNKFKEPIEYKVYKKTK